MLRKAYVEITNRCNLSCAFCPGTQRPPRDLSPAELRSIAPALRELTEYVYFHVMGEPLLHPQLAELLDIAHETGLRVILTTNGTLLSERAELLLHHPAVHKVNISLHSFEANGGALVDDSAADFARRAGAQGLRCCLRLWNLDGEQPGLRTQNTAIVARLAEQFPSPWIQNTRGFRLAPRVFLEYGERFEWPELTAPERGEAGFCYALRDQFGILSDGTVVPCCLDHDGQLALGNAFTAPLADILASDRARVISDGFIHRRRVMSLCRHCGYAARFT